MSAPVSVYVPPDLGESVARGRVRGYVAAKPGVDLPVVLTSCGVPVPIYSSTDELRAEYADHCLAELFGQRFGEVSEPVAAKLVILEVRDVDPRDDLDSGVASVAAGPVRGYAFGRPDADLVAEGSIQCAVYATEPEARAASTPRCPTVIEIREVDPR